MLAGGGSFNANENFAGRHEPHLCGFHQQSRGRPQITSASLRSFFCPRTEAFTYCGEMCRTVRRER
jgi:hypothetical protein